MATFDDLRAATGCIRRGCTTTIGPTLMYGEWRVVHNGTEREFTDVLSRDAGALVGQIAVWIREVHDAENDQAHP